MRRQHSIEPFRVTGSAGFLGYYLIERLLGIDAPTR